MKTTKSRVSALIGIALLAAAMVFLFTACPPEPEDDPKFPAPIGKLTIDSLSGFNGKYVLVTGSVGSSSSRKALYGVTSITDGTTLNLVKISDEKAEVPLYYPNTSGEYLAYNGNDILGTTSSLRIYIVDYSSLKTDKLNDAIMNNLGYKEITSGTFSGGKLPFDWGAGVDSHTHTYSATWSSNATQHWHECTANDGAKTGTANHTGDPCTVCGYDSTHTHLYSDTWSSNATQHWKECTANDGAKTGIANHTGDPCTVCGYDSTHTHTYSATWSSNATQHWHECTANDDAKTGIANHTGNPCTVCGYDSSDMTWKAVADSTIWNYTYTYNNYTSTQTGGINAIAYGNGKFVAVGEYGKMAYSTDGVNWTAVADSTIWNFINDVNITNTVGIYAIAYGNGKFVAVGERGKIAYSTDGVSWTAVTIPNWAFIYTIAYGNGKFVAGGSYGRIAYSADGVNWTVIADNSIWQYTNTGGTMYIAEIFAIAYGNDKFVAGGEYGKMAYSTDGVSWTAVADSTFYDAIAYGNGRFVAGGGRGKMAYSADGVSWTAEANSTVWNYTDEYNNITNPVVIYAIAYGNGKFVAGGYYGKIAYADW